MLCWSTYIAVRLSNHVHAHHHLASAGQSSTGTILTWGSWPFDTAQIVLKWFHLLSIAVLKLPLIIICHCCHVIFTLTDLHLMSRVPRRHALQPGVGQAWEARSCIKWFSPKILNFSGSCSLTAHFPLWSTLTCNTPKFSNFSLF